MNVQQEAVALYLFLEGRGFQPSVRSVSDCLRRQGLKFREAVVRNALLEFAKNRDASRTQLGRNPDATGTHELSTRDAVGTQLGRNRDATGTRLRAHNKVSLFSNQSPDGDGADAAPARPRRIRKGPSVTDMAAYRILDAAFPVVLEHVPDLRMTRKRWKQINKAAALDLVEQNTNAEEVVSALRVAYENPRARKYYGHITTLDKLVRHWPALRDIADGPAADDEMQQRALRGEFLPVV